MRPINEVTIAELRLCIIDLRAQEARYTNAPQRPQIAGGLSVDTLRSHIRALRRFFRWCVLEYGLDPASNPMPRIRMPACPQAPPKGITLQDLKALFQACDNSPMGIRNRAMIAFMADTGCRAAGMLTLRLDDLDLYLCRAQVTEKFDKTRIVLFTPLTAYLLRLWMDIHPPNVPTVFCSLGPTTYAQPLSLTGLHGVLKRLKQRAHIQGRVNPHAFRYGFAREYLKNGGDLASLARLMGHSDVSVTANYYAIFTQDELQVKHNQFSPMRNFYAQKERPDRGSNPASNTG
jgi:integrase/recombinase XerD